MEALGMLAALALVYLAVLSLLSKIGSKPKR